MNKESNQNSFKDKIINLFENNSFKNIKGVKILKLLKENEEIKNRFNLKFNFFKDFKEKNDILRENKENEIFNRYEYSFSPNLFIKRLSKTPSPKIVSNFDFFGSYSKSKNRIFNKIFEPSSGPYLLNSNDQPSFNLVQNIESFVKIEEKSSESYKTPIPKKRRIRRKINIRGQIKTRSQHKNNHNKNNIFIIEKIRKNCRSEGNSRLGLKYNMFSANQKQFYVNLVKNEGLDPKEVSEKYDISFKSLKRWLAVGYLRKKGCGRKVLDPTLEGKLLEWFNRSTSMGQSITPKEFTRKAKELSKCKHFMASKGWFEKIKKKYSIPFNLKRRKNNLI